MMRTSSTTEMRPSRFAVLFSLSTVTSKAHRHRFLPQVHGQHQLDQHLAGNLILEVLVSPAFLGQLCGFLVPLNDQLPASSNMKRDSATFQIP